MPNMLTSPRSSRARARSSRGAVALFIPLAWMIACGGNDNPPIAPAPPRHSAESIPSTVPSAEPPTSATPSTSAPAPAASASAPTNDSQTGAPLESKDECTPVGVDFEKRARPKLKECYATGKKETKNPNLEGTVKIKITVDVKGKIKSTKVIEKTLPDSVANCMLNVIKATPFPEVDKCWDSTLTIPVTFPTPK